MLDDGRAVQRCGAVAFWKLSETRQLTVGRMSFHSDPTGTGKVSLWYEFSHVFEHAQLVCKHLYQHLWAHIDKTESLPKAFATVLAWQSLGLLLAVLARLRGTDASPGRMGRPVK